MSDGHTASGANDSAANLEGEARAAATSLARDRAALLVHERLNSILRRLIPIGQLNTEPKAQELTGANADLFRMALVFMHAAFEDFIRGIGRALLPIAPGSALEKVPLAGERPTIDAKKFTLADLKRHAGKTVEEVIDESVSQYFERRTFSSASEVHGFLRDLGLDTRPLQSYTEDLDWLMTRRHRIVHTADLRCPGDVAPGPWTSDDMGRLICAMHAVHLASTVVLAMALEDARLRANALNQVGSLVELIRQWVVGMDDKGRMLVEANGMIAAAVSGKLPMPAARKPAR